MVFTCEKWGRLRKAVWIEGEATARKWRSWEDLDSSNWAIEEKEMDRKLVERDFRTEFMSKIRLRSYGSPTGGCHKIPIRRSRFVFRFEYG